MNDKDETFHIVNNHEGPLDLELMGIMLLSRINPRLDHVFDRILRDDRLDVSY